jgi:hypothetical protein
MDWIGIGEKADGRVETREEKSVEGMGGKIDGGERERANTSKPNEVMKGLA